MQLKKWKLENQMLLMALVLSLIGLVIFLSLLPVHKWLWAGWLFGCASIFAGHGASILLIKVFFRKKRSKVNGFFNGFGRTLLNYFFQAGMFFVVIAINTSYHHSPFLNGGVHVLAEGPIVLYSYLGGISVLALSSIASLLIKRKEGVDERIRR